MAHCWELRIDKTFGDDMPPDRGELPSRGSADDRGARAGGRKEHRRTEQCCNGITVNACGAATRPPMRQLVGDDQTNTR